MSSQNTHPYAYAFALSFSLLTPAVLADEAAPLFSPLEEIVVTAGKREQSLIDFAGSISVIKSDSLNPGASLSDVANLVPGLSVVDNGPRNITPIVMRGLRMDTVNSRDFVGDGSTVVSYVDNIPLQGFFVPPNFSLKDLQQIEVLRGPQGTLYGNASVGGLIRYITAKPNLNQQSTEIWTSLSHTDQSHGFNHDTDLVVNAPIVSDELAVRLLVGNTENEGFIDNNYLLSGPKRDINSDATSQARASVLWQANEKLSLAASYHYQNIQVDDRQASNEDFTGDEYAASSRYDQPMQGVLRLASVDATYEFDWATMTASLNRYDYKTKTQSDQTDYLLTVFGAGYYATYDDFSALTNGDLEVTKDSAEIRFASANDQPLRWLAGVFASNDDLDVVIADRVPGFDAVFNEDRPDDLDYLATQAEVLREQALYTEISYDVLPKLAVTVGGRFFRYEDSADICSLLFPTATPYIGNNYPLACIDGDDDQREALGKFSTLYKLADNHSVYLNIAQGFRRGGANFLPVTETQNRSYDADTSINYEVGTRGDFLDQKLQVSAAVFYIDWSNIQVKTFNANGRGIVANAGDARSTGVELETVVQLMDELSAKLGYSYTDAEISETVLDIDGTGGNATEGDRLPGSPRDQINLGLNYNRKINSATWDAGITYSYNTGITTAVNDTFVDYRTLDGYGLLNLKAGVELDSWYFGAYVNNLNNTRGITNTRTPDLYGDQGKYEYITRPRTLGVTVKYAF